MDVDSILEAMNGRGVDYLLIGGMNFFIRHQPVATFDVDVWIDDQADNRRRCEIALADLGAAWGETEADWRPVQTRPAGWLDRHGVYCLTSRAGNIDVFRSVDGLPEWRTCRARGVAAQTAAGIAFPALADRDLLACQLALPEEDRKLDRVRYLRRLLGDA
jgi:hypothetical protein